MKITPKPPAMPNVVDVVKTPAAPMPVPVPVPNLPGSSFTPAAGAERRYSVRFLQSIPQRLAMAGLPPKQAEDLTRRFQTMGRSALDREGRVVDTILASSHPKSGMALYDFFARLGSAVTPGGFRVEPNVEKTWTVTPPNADPFVFGAKGEKGLTLPDGTKLAPGGAGELAVGDQRLIRDVAERAGRLGVTVAVTTLSIGVTVATGGAAASLETLGSSMGGLFETMMKLAADQQQDRREARADRQAAGHAKLEAAGAAAEEKLTGLQQARDDAEQKMLTATLAGAVTILADVGGASRALTDILDAASRCAAPSRRNDPDAERAALLTAIGAEVLRLRDPATKEAALHDVSTLGDKLRGCSRDDAMFQLQQALDRSSKLAETISNLMKKQSDTESGLIKNEK